MLKGCAVSYERMVWKTDTQGLSQFSTFNSEAVVVLAVYVTCEYKVVLRISRAFRLIMSMVKIGLDMVIIPNYLLRCASYFGLSQPFSFDPFDVVIDFSRAGVGGVVLG